MILYLAADLIWATKIKETATALDIPCRPVRNPEMLAARLADSPVVAFLADLDVADTAIDLISRARELNAGTGRRLRIVAWGPHVAKDLFQRARDAGADEVLTRGAFDHGMPEILLGLAGRSG